MACTRTCGDDGCALGLDIGAIEDPRSVGQRMFGNDLASLNGKPQCAGAYTDQTRGLREVEPPFTDASLGAVDRDLVMTSQRGNPLAGPEITTSGTKTIAVEDVRDQGIGTDPRQQAHGIERRRRSVAAVLSATTSWNAYLGMYAALPMDYEHDLARGIVDIHSNFVNQRSYDALAQASIGIRMLPELLELLGER